MQAIDVSSRPVRRGVLHMTFSPSGTDPSETPRRLEVWLRYDGKVKQRSKNTLCTDASWRVVSRGRSD